MIMDSTFQAWQEEKLGLENDYPYSVHPSPDLNKSQVFLSSIDELRDERNPFDIEFHPSTLEEGRAFDRLLNTELQYDCLLLEQSVINDNA
jgi:hypothetical protein